MNPPHHYHPTPAVTSAEASLILRATLFSCLLVILGVLLFGSAAHAQTQTNHPPTISWLPDQRILPGGTFTRQHFRIGDKETPLTSLIISVGSTNTTFTDPIGITWGLCNYDDIVNHGCSADGGYYIDFPHSPGTSGDPSATVKVTVTDGGNPTKSATSSFTLRADSPTNPAPVMAGIPNEAISPSDVRYGPVWFVVSDLNSSGVDDTFGPAGDCGPGITFDKSSDNTDLVPIAGIDVRQVGNMRTFQVTVSPNLNTAPHGGRAVITITAIDPDCNKTSTSFVLDVTDPNITNTAPSITGTDGTYVEQDVTHSSTAFYHFNVSDSETPDSQLLVSATSSNAKLVPNDATHLNIGSISSNGAGKLSITPVLPLPSPSPGVPQAATITLSVTDDAYTRRTQFLYVAKNPTSAALSFSRPTGVWNLDPDNTQHRGDDAFLNGEMRRISWRCIANDSPNPTDWDWTLLDDAYTEVYNQGRDLSINLIEEPCYIAIQEQPLSMTWCDTNSMSYACPSTSPTPCPCTDGDGNTGILRAVPWDSYLQQQRKTFLTELARHHLPIETGGNTVAGEVHIPIINANLPGGNTGIRELNDVQFSDPPFTGYTRPALLAAVQTELRAQVGFFANKFIHIGFFIVEDNLHPQSGESLWHYLYSKLTNEFNGIKKPRVHFFQEDLAATRLSAAPDYIPYIAPPNNTTAYSFTPNHCQLPSFVFPCGFTVDDCDPLVVCPPTDAEYNNGITYQANTPWSSPFMPVANNDDKVKKTLNGTPNDGIEAAFNSYLNEYLEVYPQDLDHAQAPTPPGSPTPSPTPADAAKWAAGLKSWHDYLGHVANTAPLDAPAGLTVARGGATSNTVIWYGVYRATSYTLQTKSLSPPGSWTNVTGCDSTSTSCTDTSSTSSRYAYRVQASNGTLLSPWAQVAVFISEGTNDGYVSVSNGTATPVPNAAQPGIQAGQGSNSNVSGIVSFNTGILTAGVTVLNAKLRLKQYTSNTAFDALGPCIVDIRKGPLTPMRRWKRTISTQWKPTWM